LIKIARIIPYFKSSFGGPVNHLKKLILGMRDLDIKNYIITTNVDKKRFLHKRDKILVSNKVNIFKYTPLLKFYHFFLTPQMIVELLKNKFDIIDLRCVRNFQVDLTLIFYSIFRRNVPIILNTHGTMSTPDLSRLNYLFKKVYYIFFEKFLLKRVNYFIVVSKLEKESLIKQKIPAEKILIISHGKDILIDTNKITPGNFRKKYDLDKNPIIISCIGRIFEGKGIQNLLRAIPILEKKVKDFKVVIAGKDDGYLNYLREMVKNLKIENKVLFTGYLPKKNGSLWELIKDTDILVSPSISESFGHVFIEGISFKIPIIYSNQNNILLENNISGIYVPFGNFKILANKINKLIINREYCNFLVSNALNNIEKLPFWDDIIKKHNKLYQILI